MVAKASAEVTLSVKDGGSAKGVKKDIDALAVSTEKLRKTSKKTVRGGNKLKRNLEGIGARANNTTKDFSRMTQGMGGLVQAYATVAANVFALSTAFIVMKNAVNFDDMISSARNLSAEFGTSFLSTAAKIQKATKAQIDFKTALKSANKASASGISAKNVEKFAEAAAKSAQTFGGTTTDALNRMITAILQGETELLKEVGIVISSREAFRDFGIEIGKSGDKLTSFEKRQALTNAVLKESLRLFGGTTISVNQFEVLAAVLEDNGRKVLTFVNNSVGLQAVIGGIANSLPALGAGVALFARSIIGKLAPGLEEVTKKAKESADNSRKIAIRAGLVAVIDKKKLEKKKLNIQKDADVKLNNQQILAAQEKINLLRKQGKIEERFFKKKNSTLARISRGEAISQKGVESLRRAGQSVQLKREGDPRGLSARDRTALFKVLTPAAQASTSAIGKFNLKLTEGAGAVRNFSNRTKVYTSNLKAANQTTSAAILRATQGTTGLRSYSAAFRATEINIKRMAVEARRLNTTITLGQIAMARSTLAIKLMGKVFNSLFGLVTTVIIVVSTLQFVAEALGLSFFTTSKAAKELKEQAKSMSASFEESSITLSGLIKRLEVFRKASPDKAFQSISKSTGNFISEVSVKIGEQAAFANAQIFKLIATQKKLDLATQKSLDLRKKAAEVTTFVRIGRKVRRVSRVTEDGPPLISREAVDALEAQIVSVIGLTRSLKNTVDDLTESTKKGSEVLISVFDNATEQLSILAIGAEKDFDLLGELTKLPIVEELITTKVLKNISDTTTLFGLLRDKLLLVSSPEMLANIAKVGAQINNIGLKGRAAAAASEELSAQTTIFLGKQTTLNKEAFSSESIQSFVTQLETADKSLKIIGEGFISQLLGADKFKKSLGSTAETAAELRKEVLALLEVFDKFGAGIRALESQSTGIKERNKLLGLQAKSLASEEDKLRILKIQESNSLNILFIEKEILKATIKVQEVSFLKGNVAAKELIINAKAELATLEQSIKLQELGLRILKDENNILASKRQQTRKILTLNTQVLSAEIALASTRGESVIVAEKLVALADKRLESKSKDLELDAESLLRQVTALEVGKEEFERRALILGLRLKELGIIREQLILEQKLNVGANIFRTAASTTTEAGKELDTEMLVNAILISGAKEFIDAVKRNNPLKTLMEGAFKALDAGIESLVATIGTGSNIFKSVIKAIDDTLRTSVIETVSSSIKVELLKVFGDTANKLKKEAKELADKANAEAKATLEATLTTARDLAVLAKTTSEAVVLRNTDAELQTQRIIAALARIKIPTSFKGGEGEGVFRLGVAGQELSVDPITGQRFDPFSPTFIGTTDASVTAAAKPKDTEILNESKGQTVIEQDSLVELKNMASLLASSTGGIAGVAIGFFGGLLGALLKNTGEKTVSDPKPPGFALGGIVNKPTVALIGEGRNFEAVVPLPNNREIPVRIENNTESTGTVITNNFDFSGADAQTETRIRALIERNGNDTFNRVFGEVNRGGKFSKIVGRRT